MSEHSKGADAVVVGGGVVGCLAARALASGGLSVIVVDRSEPGTAATWAAGGMLAPLAEAEEPGPFLALGLESLRIWPGFARELEAETGRPLHYLESGMLRIALDEAGAERLRFRARRLEEAGHAGRWLPGDAAREREPRLSPEVRGALHHPNAHQVDNRRLGRAAYHGARRAGVSFRLGTAVAGIRSSGDAVSGVRLEDGAELSASAVVVAAGAWSGRLDGLPRALPVRPVRGQMVAVQAEPGFLSTIVESERVYLIPRRDGRIIVGSTMEEAGFEAETTVRAVRDLLAGAGTAVPGLEEASVSEVWAGLRPGTPDDLPILGEDPDLRGLLYATGHFRNGILLAPVTARAVSELVLGGEPTTDLAPFRPDRFGRNMLVGGREQD